MRCIRTKRYRASASVMLLAAVVMLAACGEDRTSPAGATRHYWQQLRQISQEAEPIEQRMEQVQTPAEVIGVLREAAVTFRDMSQKISALPVEQVDPELVAFAAEHVMLLSRSAAWAQAMASLGEDGQALEAYAQSPQAFGEAFLRGFLGDPLGAHHDLQQAGAELQWRHQAMAQQWAEIEQTMHALQGQELTLRRTLAQRHGGSFPALDPE